MDPRITARKAGFVDASAFRLSFIGKTSSLRSLLNKLGTFELPLVVRSVEVEAGDPEPGEPPLNDNGEPIKIDPAKPEPKFVPKVEVLRSKFTVTIEYIDLVSAAQPQSAPAH